MALDIGQWRAVSLGSFIDRNKSSISYECKVGGSGPFGSEINLVPESRTNPRFLGRPLLFYHYINNDAPAPVFFSGI